MRDLLERRFGLRAAGTTVRREVTAGLATFCALSYILFFQPALLSLPLCGMPADGVLFATCVASAVACFLMAWWANYPIALAPGMGVNVFFAITVCGELGFSWQEALAANFLAGVVFLALGGSGLRERAMGALPPDLRFALAVGIGLFIAMLGLQWGNLVVDAPHTYVRLGALDHPVALLSITGLVITSVCVARGVPAAILVGILSTTGLGAVASRVWELDPVLVAFDGTVFAAPPSPTATAFSLDFTGLFARPLESWLGILLVFLVLDLFDTVGTLMGVGDRAGLLEDGRLPRARGALAADATGSVVGALLGTSTVTSYVESAAGVASGGRTGLTAVVVGVLMLCGLFCLPLIRAVGAGVDVDPTEAVSLRYPVLCPVLVLIGVLMMAAVKRIAWDDPKAAIPAFLTIIVMQLSVSITDGLAFGLISFSVLRFATGTLRGTSPLTHVLSLLLLLRYLYLPA